MQSGSASTCWTRHTAASRAAPPRRVPTASPIRTWCRTPSRRSNASSPPSMGRGITGSWSAASAASGCLPTPGRSCTSPAASAHSNRTEGGGAGRQAADGCAMPGDPTCGVRSRPPMLRAFLPAVLVLAVAPSHAAAAARIFPSDRWTVRDPAQVTGRRVHLPLRGDCPSRPSDCAELQRLNRLDGFDVEPRVQVSFDRRIDVGKVRARTLSLRAVGGGPAIGLDRLVWDPATRILTGSPVRRLRPATRYRVRVAAALAGAATSDTFTTMTTTVQLRRMAAGVRASGPALHVLGTLPAGTPMTRLVDRGGATPDAEPVPDLSATGAAQYVFGALDVPTWLRPDRTFATVPTKRAPAPLGRTSASFTLILPAGTPPPGGWPVAIFGHGFLRSHYDVFLAARGNAANGVATIAIDAVGHGGGPRGAIVAHGTVLPAPGRGRDPDGDGVIGDLGNPRTPPRPAPRSPPTSRTCARRLSRPPPHRSCPATPYASPRWTGAGSSPRCAPACRTCRSSRARPSPTTARAWAASTAPWRRRSSRGS